MAHDHGQATGHRFIHNHSPRISICRKNEHFSESIVARKLFPLDKTGKFDFSTRDFGFSLLQLLANGTVSNKDQTDLLTQMLIEFGIGPHEFEDSFFLYESAYKKRIAIRQPKLASIRIRIPPRRCGQ